MVVLDNAYEILQTEEIWWKTVKNKGVVKVDLAPALYPVSADPYPAVLSSRWFHPAQMGFPIRPMPNSAATAGQPNHRNSSMKRVLWS
ncbi:beta-1,3-galactosyltransferase 2-like isoform X3 [Puntigrus tetrazona]|uniref:beta-1,3-galactosyltransferase 2-like isoform X3 n=1 Tax=Puntigrus tetrazona TaxID=1606681 RepID=UPI001C89BAAD|nr:beta-1,3-galactosyltransferase 2-like isoform X3 [Puntigrus tetrazona]